MVGEFAPAIANYIRNPLSSIRTTAELARDSSATEQGKFDCIVESCDKIETWVRNLLYFLHRDSSKTSSVDPHPLMESCMEDFQREFRCDNDRLRFSAIRDRGPGIQPEVMSRLFDSFFTTKSNGMGMGLALARRAVERFGGAITASSIPGAGTVFTIELPQV